MPCRPICCERLSKEEREELFTLSILRNSKDRNEFHSDTTSLDHQNEISVVISTWDVSSLRFRPTNRIDKSESLDTKELTLPS